jgi:hypothetical protein
LVEGFNYFTEVGKGRNMSNTPNHDYNIPSAGTSDWHVPLNENFEKLDSDIEIRGTEADKQDYDPKIGSKYESTDTGAIYYGDGENWILTDREVNQLRAENIAVTQIQGNGPLIVSPSVNAGYNSLQSALDDAADGRGREILITEDIQENVLIKSSKTGEPWNRRGGLKIKGANGRETQIKDDLADGTPIIEVENQSFTGLGLEDLWIEPRGENTRAFSQARYEEDTNGALQLSYFSNCRFQAPVIVSKVFHCYFQNCVFRPKVGTKRDGYGEPIYPGFMLNAGNQYMFDRCHFVDATGKLKYGTCWMSGANSALFNSCFFSMTTKGYNEEVDRPVAPLLIDTGGDILFNLPYCEKTADYSMVTDAIEGGGSAIDNIRIIGSRIKNIKINNRVKGLVIDQPFRDIELDVTDGVAAEGSWVRSGNQDINVIGDDKGWVRIYQGRPKGWNVPTPGLPQDGDSVRRNDYSVPVIIYQSGMDGVEMEIEDYWGNNRVLPAGIRTVILGLNERIIYNSSYPDEWEWYGME